MDAAVEGDSQAILEEPARDGKANCFLELAHRGIAIQAPALGIPENPVAVRVLRHAVQVTVFARPPSLRPNTPHEGPRGIEHQCGLRLAIVNQHAAARRTEDHLDRAKGLLLGAILRADLQLGDQSAHERRRDLTLDAYTNGVAERIDGGCPRRIGTRRIGITATGDGEQRTEQE
jgi:hypothetical protein